ncbi:MAG: ABC transporter ATP-binding protein [Rhodospirillaceae bacterium]|nr:ABC transporter ATP-binding protein [Rhodospirillaceae bacterium]
MLTVRALDAGYGRSQALFGVSLEIADGETVALSGPNGAGKSTLLKTIAGLVTPSRGSIVLNGVELAGLPSHHIARHGVGYVPEGRRIFADLTVAENLETGRRPAARNRAAWTEARILALFPPLESLMHRAGGTLSGGEQQMLAIGRTLMGNPSLLLLDEPAEGLAPLMVAAVGEAIRSVKTEGVSILLSEQSPSFDTDLIDRVLTMERGRLEDKGPDQGPAAIP